MPRRRNQRRESASEAAGAIKLVRQFHRKFAGIDRRLDEDEDPARAEKRIRLFRQQIAAVREAAEFRDLMIARRISRDLQVIDKRRERASIEWEIKNAHTLERRPPSKDAIARRLLLRDMPVKYTVENS